MHLKRTKKDIEHQGVRVGKSNDVQIEMNRIIYLPI